MMHIDDVARPVTGLQVGITLAVVSHILPCRHGGPVRVPWQGSLDDRTHLKTMAKPKMKVNDWYLQGNPIA